jgi:hypothetical protein
MKPEITSHSLDESATLANQISRVASVGDVITLKGDLGSGKTFLAKHLISSLTKATPEEIQSPTFSLLQIYDAKGAYQIYHFDLYRLKNSDELYELGFDEALEGTNLVIIEWPEIADHLIPKSRLEVSIGIRDSDRVFSFNENMWKRLYG